MRKHFAKIKKVVLNLKFGFPKHWLKFGFSLRFSGFRSWPIWPSDWTGWLRFGILGLIIIYFLVGVGMVWQLRRAKNNFCQESIVADFYPLPAAYVAGEVIWRHNFCQLVKQNDYFYEVTKQAPPGREQLYQEISDLLIEDKILSSQARHYNLEVGWKDVEDTVDKMAEENGGADVLEKMLDETYNTTLHQFKKIVRVQLQREKLEKEIVIQVKARHILIKDEARTKDILQRLQKGDDFNNLAKEFSEDINSRDKNGDLGWFGKGQMVKEFEQAAFATPVGKIYDQLVKTEYGYHIIIVDEKKGQVDKSFNEWLKELKDKTRVWRVL
ncbi:MAG: foldase protein PrsA, partial [Candidatus Berkelbacteria bacterium Licking1014_2]